MKKQVTDVFTLVEQRDEHYPGEMEQKFSKYGSRVYIDDSEFHEAMKKLGGYHYNVCVGRLGDMTIFNGGTWIGIHSKSHDDNDAKLVEFEQKLGESGWERRLIPDNCRVC